MMTTQIGTAATAKTLQVVAGRQGLRMKLANLSLAGMQAAATLEVSQIRMQNVAGDLAERGGLVKYPVVNIYCQKIVNEQREKFRAFSGRVVMAMELRHSQERLDGLESRLQLYADAATQLLTGARGDWGEGMFYGGAFEVAFGAVKQGGRNYVQSATVTFGLEVSR